MKGYKKSIGLSLSALMLLSCINLHATGDNENTNQSNQKVYYVAGVAAVALLGFLLGKVDLQKHGQALVAGSGIAIGTAVGANAALTDSAREAALRAVEEYITKMSLR